MGVGRVVYDDSPGRYPHPLTTLESPRSSPWPRLESLTMSGIAADLAHVEHAFGAPALHLLSRRNAALVVAVFGHVFHRGHEPVPADRFHALIDTLMGELRGHGTAVPDEPARVLGRRWVDEQWLVLAIGDGGDEQYALTSHARDAIDCVHRLAGDRSVFGQSRIRTIVDAARRCALDAEPDNAQRVSRLDHQIEELRALRDRLAVAIPESVPDERLVEQYLNVRDMTAQLPADFLRTAERVKDIHRTLVEEFQREDRRSGEVLDLYLQRSAALMSESLEGKAFGGAVELLRDEDLMSQLRGDLETIAAHPFARTLPSNELTDFVDTVGAIRRGIAMVLDARRKLSSTLRAYITSHDALRDREVDEALRQAKKELAAWMRSSGPRARVPLELGMGGIQIGNTRERFYDPAEHAAPPPLADVAADACDAPSLEDLRRRGGPSMPALRAAVAAAASGDSASAAAIFESLPDELRRPVEVFGLMQLAAAAGALDEVSAGQEGIVEAVRVDGTRRRLVLPGIVFAPQQLSRTDHEQER